MLHLVYMSPASSNAGAFWPFLTMTHCGQCSVECPSMWVCLMFCHEVMDSFGRLPEVMCPCFIRGHMILIWLITGDVNINYLVKVEFATVLHYKGVFVCFLHSLLVRSKTLNPQPTLKFHLLETRVSNGMWSYIKITKLIYREILWG